jgi:hypothetical protein
VELLVVGVSVGSGGGTAVVVVVGTASLVAGAEDEGGAAPSPSSPPQAAARSARASRGARSFIGIEYAGPGDADRRAWRYG